VWAGWAPIIYANNALKRQGLEDAWRQDFKVELTLIDDPVRCAMPMRGQCSTSGGAHSTWFRSSWKPCGKTRALCRGSSADRLVEWRHGNRGSRKCQERCDLRGKTIVLAQNFAIALFRAERVDQRRCTAAEVNFKFTQDAFQAAAAFNADKRRPASSVGRRIYYNLAKVKGNRMLVNTGTANKLIADIWFARADFAKDNPEIIEA